MGPTQKTARPGPQYQGPRFGPPAGAATRFGRPGMGQQQPPPGMMPGGPPPMMGAPGGMDRQQMMASMLRGGMNPAPQMMT